MDDGLERFADWAKESLRAPGHERVSSHASRLQRRRQHGRIVHTTALEQTVAALYDAALAEIKRIQRLKIRERLEKENLPEQEVRKHKALVRWLLVQRRSEQGCTVRQIGREIGQSSARVRQLLHSKEPVFVFRPIRQTAIETGPPRRGSKPRSG